MVKPKSRQRSADHGHQISIAFRALWSSDIEVQIRARENLEYMLLMEESLRLCRYHKILVRTLCCEGGIDVYNQEDIRIWLKDAAYMADQVIIKHAIGHYTVDYEIQQPYIDILLRIKRIEIFLDMKAHDNTVQWSRGVLAMHDNEIPLRLDTATDDEDESEEDIGLDRPNEGDESSADEDDEDDLRYDPPDVSRLRNFSETVTLDADFGNGACETSEDQANEHEKQMEGQAVAEANSQHADDESSGDDTASSSCAVEGGASVQQDINMESSDEESDKENTEVDEGHDVERENEEDGGNQEMKSDRDTPDRSVTDSNNNSENSDDTPSPILRHRVYYESRFVPIPLESRITKASDKPDDAKVEEKLSEAEDEEQDNKEDEGDDEDEEVKKIVSIGCDIHPDEANQLQRYLDMFFSDPTGVCNALNAYMNARGISESDFTTNFSDGQMNPDQILYRITPNAHPTTKKPDRGLSGNASVTEGNSEMSENEGCSKQSGQFRSSEYNNRYKYGGKNYILGNIRNRGRTGNAGKTYKGNETHTLINHFSQDARLSYRVPDMRAQDSDEMGKSLEEKKRSYSSYLADLVLSSGSGIKDDDGEPMKKLHKAEEGHETL